jgi:hypothetical protein
VTSWLDGWSFPAPWRGDVTFGKRSAPDNPCETDHGNAANRCHNRRIICGGYSCFRGHLHPRAGWVAKLALGSGARFGASRRCAAPAHRIHWRRLAGRAGARRCLSRRFRRGLLTVASELPFRLENAEFRRCVRSGSSCDGLKFLSFFLLLSPRA